MKNTDNDITKTPAAELVGEYERWQHCPRRFKFTRCGDCGKYDQETGLGYCVYCKSTSLNPLGEGVHAADIIAQELDRRCEAAGVRLKGSVFVFSRIRRNGDYTYIGQGHADDVGGSELHALLGWLLMKETK